MLGLGCGDATRRGVKRHGLRAAQRAPGVCASTFESIRDWLYIALLTTALGVDSAPNLCYMLQADSTLFSVPRPITPAGDTPGYSPTKLGLDAKEVRFCALCCL